MSSYKCFGSRYVSLIFFYPSLRFTLSISPKSCKVIRRKFTKITINNLECFYNLKIFF